MPSERPKLRYDEYPFAIYRKVFGLLYPCFQENNGQLETLFVHAKLRELQQSDSDLSWLVFHTQSNPYSYEVEEIIGLISLDGLVRVSSGHLLVTDYGVKKGEEYRETLSNRQVIQ